MKNKRLLALLISVLIVGILLGWLLARSTTPTNNPPTNTETSTEVEEPQTQTNNLIDEDGIYDTKDEVALYIHTYNKLPKNYMTKSEARKHGWEGGALHLVVDNMCIGGDIFTNYEGELPEIDGTYYECDIDTLNSKKRGAKRIVFSDEGDIYYTSDHYDTFELLYGADDD